MFDLNNGSLTSGGTTIFNNGIAGKVSDVSIAIKRKEETGPLSYADYNLVVTDAAGTNLNGLFSYHKNNDQYDDAKNRANQGYLLGRIQSIAQSVVPDGFVYPDVKDLQCNQIMDVLFKIIHDNAEGKKVNVFTTYGSKAKPSTFLGLRFFDFIESTTKTPSRLSVKGNDMMERIVADVQTGGQEPNTSAAKPAW